MPPLPPLPPNSIRDTFFTIAAEPTFRPSAASCRSMLGEAAASIGALNGMVSGISPDSLEELLRDPDNRALIEDRLNEATTKLRSVTHSCRGVITDEEIERAEELAREGEALRQRLGAALSRESIDAIGRQLRAFASSAADLLMGAAGAVLGGLGWLLQDMLQPSRSY